METRCIFDCASVKANLPKSEHRTRFALSVFRLGLREQCPIVILAPITYPKELCIGSSKEEIDGEAVAATKHCPKQQRAAGAAPSRSPQFESFCSNS